MNGPRQSGWARLEEHFAHHASLVDRFSTAGPSAVLGMVQSGRNERGQILSAFEREALVERYCDICGSWPEIVECSNATELIDTDLPN